MKCFRLGTDYMPFTKLQSQTHVEANEQATTSGTTHKNVSWEIKYSELTLEKEIGRGGNININVFDR